MSPYRTPEPCSVTDLCSRPPLLPCSPLDDPSHEPSLSATLPSSSPVPAGHSCVSVVSFAPFQVSSGPTLITSPDRSTSLFLGADPSLSLRSAQSNMVPQRSPGQALSPVPPSTPNPYPAPCYHVSVIIPSPDLHLSPLQSRCLESMCPDLECSICFSQFNNVFRCPKMLQCKHTFCLECLARINVKSAQPSTIQCPLCRGVTPLPALGLPTLATDVSVLTYLPAAMQRVYSIRFLRSKGRLQVKRYGSSPETLAGRCHYSPQKGNDRILFPVKIFCRDTKMAPGLRPLSGRWASQPACGESRHSERPERGSDPADGQAGMPSLPPDIDGAVDAPADGHHHLPHHLQTG